jgi:hypothetical protein
MDKVIEDAMWAGDMDTLYSVADCICCCDEHTYENCPAREWFGCRGQNTMTRKDEKKWAVHYFTHHGMTDAQFFGAE